ncbi:hypothetical protein PENCOP_c011G04056 [Penicillium coprophilum]|uniref:PNPLA domain-containing protein n=1 Tax=Penicillium coprophilum TaxID=36646 RepID=A0A1V6UEH7_9EURO|nr:hypothetical protein PENCOP_c011G04056 [Penicillium coprophilum]
MLGRLEMGVDECILAYTELMESVFSEKLNKVPVDWSGKIVSQFDSKRLKKAIENVITRAGLSPADLMNDGKPRRSKTFVCTTSKDTFQVTRLRSYSVPNEMVLPATICEAALATSAATRFFDSVSIGNQLFVDGAFGANNPIEEVEEEAADIWCTTSRALRPLVKCLVSVGTGNPAQLPMNDNVLKFLSKTLVRMATKPESTERRFMARWSNEVKGKRYFRFNVEQGLQQVHMTDFEKQSVIESATYAYLHHSSQKVRIRDCILNLSEKQGKTSIDFETYIREHEARVTRHRILQTIQSSDNPFGSKTPPGWFVPFERNPRYVDREIVGKVKRRLFSDNRAEIIAIVGLGGIGKTQIALELAYQTREIYPDCAIFWLPVVDMESLHQAYQPMAEQLGIDLGDRKEDLKSLVKDHLSKPSAGRWLLIFDNADEIDMWTESKSSKSGSLKDYLPTSDQGVILFTTRSNKVAQYLATTNIIRIPEMDEQKATHVLQNSLVDKEVLHDTESTRKLLSRLTFLPLAIVQAASFINENGTTLAGYVELLDGQEQSAIDLLSEDFEDKGRYRSIRNPVATTWLTSFEQIQKQNGLAADYLCFMACMQEKDILVSLLPPDPTINQRKAIGLLSSYSFIRVRNEDSRLDMHRLVHLATRNWLQSIGSLRQWQLQALSGLATRFPRIDIAHRSQWRATVPHALRVLNLTAGEVPVPTRLQVLLNVAESQMFDWRFKEAELLYSEIVKVSEAMLGLENIWSVRGLIGLAKSYLWQRKIKQAIALCEEVLEIQTRLHGSSSFAANQALVDLSDTYHTAGDLKKSQALYKKVIPYFLETMGPGCDATMNLITRLVMSYHYNGHLSDATELSVQLLHITRRTSGPEHPGTLTVMNGMAIIYMQRWRLKEAEALFTEELEIEKRIYGLEHPITIATMALLATTWKEQGRRKAAIALMTECVSLSGQVNGFDHASTQTTYSKLEEWKNPKTLRGFLHNYHPQFRRADMIIQRNLRFESPKVKGHGFWYIQPRNDPLIREIQEAVKTMSLDRRVPSGKITVVEGQDTEHNHMMP